LGGGSAHRNATQETPTQFTPRAGFELTIPVLERS